MTQELTFQQVILKLHQFWADQGCVIWRPYNVQVGAGTANPATTLRVLGPEPWRVAYVEPSVRPDDGRYGDNPNRLQMHTQYQVILKPDPGNPQELYLASLEAIGLNPREHDIRFVEDNWESPALGAWGLGWEVWLDGQEITQFTYFQQAGGLELNPVSVELTYGLERIVLALQGKDGVWDVNWLGDEDHGTLLYQDIFLRSEFEHSKYYFEVASVEGMRETYDVYEQEFRVALENEAVLPAYDYVLKCSHLFNVLDTRGAIGVTERAKYFRRMRDMTREIAKAVVQQREALDFPLERMNTLWAAPELEQAGEMPAPPAAPADVLLEIGVEELPAADVTEALEQLQTVAATLFDDLRLAHGDVMTYATPRRLVLAARDVAPRQTDEERVEKGPPADRAFDAEGNPTKAAQGFARGKGVDVADLKIEEVDGGRYVMVTVREEGRPAPEVLAEAFEELIGNIRFGKNMRWNATNIAFSRPIRWIVALFGEQVIPFAYAGVASGSRTRGLRPYGSPTHDVTGLDEYVDVLDNQHIILDMQARRDAVRVQAEQLAEEVGGRIPEDSGLLDEVTNLVEAPLALMGSFGEEYLVLPREVLITVMRKHQRYFAVEDATGKLLPYFIAVRNGDAEHLDKVRKGNEHVIRARFSDADFFFKEDRSKPLKDFLPRLGTLTFHEKIGSMLEKNERVAALVDPLGDLLGVDATAIGVASQAAFLAKADLATQMVVEMTSLQGVMGREYALMEEYPEPVATAIFEHWLPRGADDILPETSAGVLLALTDRLDTLVGLFGAGLAPKGSADPFGLRRAALGMVQILTHHALDVDLVQAVELAANAQPIEVSSTAREDALTFIQGRLSVWMLDELGLQHDAVQAVLAEQATNPHRALVGVRELEAWSARDNWQDVLDAFARCVRITRAESTHYSVDETLFEQNAERALFQAYEHAVESLNHNANVATFLNAFEPMIPAVSAFFDEVLVNAEDERVRENRLGLLQYISSLSKTRADLSHMQGF